MNSIKYNRKVKQTTLDKLKRKCIQQKYFYQYDNNSYMELNNNDNDTYDNNIKKVDDDDDNDDDNDDDSIVLDFDKRYSYYTKYHYKGWKKYQSTITICEFYYDPVYYQHKYNHIEVQEYTYTIEERPYLEEKEYWHIYKEHKNKNKNIIGLKEKNGCVRGCIRCNIIGRTQHVCLDNNCHDNNHTTMCFPSKPVYKCLHRNKIRDFFVEGDYYENILYYDVYAFNLNICYELHVNLDEYDSDDYDFLDLYYDSKYVWMVKCRQTIYKFKYTYYCLKFKKQFRDWLWIRVRLPNISNQYCPNNLNALIINCNTDDELFTKLDTW